MTHGKVLGMGGKKFRKRRRSNLESGHEGLNTQEAEVQSNEHAEWQANEEADGWRDGRLDTAIRRDSPEQDEEGDKSEGLHEDLKGEEEGAAMEGVGICLLR